MNIKSTVTDLFSKTRNQMDTLNDEYEKMSLKNRTNSLEIRTAIEKRTKEIDRTKQNRNKHFNFIRNK
jgi:hypothetical protein